MGLPGVTSVRVLTKFEFVSSSVLACEIVKSIGWRWWTRLTIRYVLSRWRGDELRFSLDVVVCCPFTFQFLGWKRRASTLCGRQPIKLKKICGYYVIIVRKKLALSGLSIFTNIVIRSAPFRGRFSGRTCWLTFLSLGYPPRVRVIVNMALQVLTSSHIGGSDEPKDFGGAGPASMS